MRGFFFMCSVFFFSFQFFCSSPVTIVNGMCVDFAVFFLIRSEILMKDRKYAAFVHFFIQQIFNKFNFLTRSFVHSFAWSPQSFDVCSLCIVAWLKLKLKGCISILCMYSWFYIRYGSTIFFFSSVRSGASM